MGTRTIKLGSSVSVADAAAEGAKALRAGMLVGFPTETVYGISCLASDADALERLRKLKSRPARPFSIHLGRSEDVRRYVRQVPSQAKRLMNKTWPGPVTIILHAGGEFADPSLAGADLYAKLTCDDMIAFRAPESEVAQAMLSAVDGPVVATSANLAGQPSPRSGREVLAELDGQIDLLIDSGPCRYGKDSTIVRVDAQGWELVREGVYDESSINKLMRQKFLFVCTGNTCRSPIAAGLARKILADQSGCAVKELPDKGIEVGSAGLFSMGGSPATPEAITAAGENGADISDHRSQKATIKLINESDVVFCMTQFHVDQVLRLVPKARTKVKRLDPNGDIPDPIGGGSDVYRKTAEQIGEALKGQMGQRSQ